MGRSIHGQRSRLWEMIFLSRRLLSAVYKANWAWHWKHFCNFGHPLQGTGTKGNSKRTHGHLASKILYLWQQQNQSGRIFKSFHRVSEDIHVTLHHQRAGAGNWETWSKSQWRHFASSLERTEPSAITCIYTQASFRSCQVHVPLSKHTGQAYYQAADKHRNVSF